MTKEPRTHPAISNPHIPPGHLTVSLPAALGFLPPDRPNNPFAWTSRCSQLPSPIVSSSPIHCPISLSSTQNQRLSASSLGQPPLTLSWPTQLPHNREQPHSGSPRSRTTAGHYISLNLCQQVFPSSASAHTDQPLPPQPDNGIKSQPPLPQTGLETIQQQPIHGRSSWKPPGTWREGDEDINQRRICGSEGRSRSEKQRKKKIKINCHLLRFLGFTDDGDPHR